MAADEFETAPKTMKRIYEDVAECDLCVRVDAAWRDDGLCMVLSGSALRYCVV